MSVQKTITEGSKRLEMYDGHHSHIIPEGCRPVCEKQVLVIPEFVQQKQVKVKAIPKMSGLSEEQQREYLAKYSVDEPYVPFELTDHTHWQTTALPKLIAPRSSKSHEFVRLMNVCEKAADTEVLPLKHHDMPTSQFSVDFGVLKDLEQTPMPSIQSIAPHTKASEQIVSLDNAIEISSDNSPAAMIFDADDPVKGIQIVEDISDDIDFHDMQGPKPKTPARPHERYTRLPQNALCPQMAVESDPFTPQVTATPKLLIGKNRLNRFKPEIDGSVQKPPTIPFSTLQTPKIPLATNMLHNSALVEPVSRPASNSAIPSSDASSPPQIPAQRIKTNARKHVVLESSSPVSISENQIPTARTRRVQFTPCSERVTNRLQHLKSSPDTHFQATPLLERRARRMLPRPAPRIRDQEPDITNDTDVRPLKEKSLKRKAKACRPALGGEFFDIEVDVSSDVHPSGDETDGSRDGIDSFVVSQFSQTQVEPTDMQAFYRNSLLSPLRPNVGNQRRNVVTSTPIPTVYEDEDVGSLEDFVVDDDVSLGGLVSMDELDEYESCPNSPSVPRIKNKPWFDSTVPVDSAAPQCTIMTKAEVDQALDEIKDIDLEMLIDMDFDEDM